VVAVCSADQHLENSYGGCVRKEARASIGCKATGRKTSKYFDFLSEKHRIYLTDFRAIFVRAFSDRDEPVLKALGALPKLISLFLDSLIV